MTLLLSLRDRVDEHYLEWLVKTSPDELAPQLSRVVRELLQRETRHIMEEAIPFIRATVLTNTFRTILRGVFKALRENSAFAKWLNLDMGSGKTHLLTLIVYLFYAYDLIKEHLDEYYRLGLDRNIARHTALLVVDLRTPSEIMRTFFPFFARSLEKVDEHDAAQYVRSCAERNVFPEASELVRKLRNATRLVVIVDELHHALLTYRGTENERRWVRGFIDFVTQLIDYLRHYGMGFVILVASARRDYERILQISDREELLLAAENLLSQLGRLEPVLETQWLSVEEAKQIVLRKLGAKEDVFHPLFNKFIERIIRAESDIPQAQHLRSLIKAMAVYTKSAIDMGHFIVTPASFNESVLDALFPEGGGIADRYRSIYAQIINEIERLENIPADVKKLTKLIVNTVFTMSISGRPDQLIETIKACKLGKYTTELLPAVSEQEITKLLEDLNLKDYAKVSEAFDILNRLPYIHSVKVGTTYVYFVVPIESLITLLNRLIEEKFKSSLADRETILKEFLSYLNTLIGKVNENAYITVVNDYNSLEEVTKGIDPNTMYIIVYAESELVKYLENSLRTGVYDINELIRGWFRRKGSRDLATWLSEHQRHNMAIIVPVPDETVTRNVAWFRAVEEAVGKIVNDYLLEYTKSGSKLPDEVRRLIELELAEIHKALGSKLVDAVRSFVEACSLALSHVYIYECNHDPESGIKCSVSLKNVKASGIVPTSIYVDQNRYNKLIEILKGHRDRGVRDLISELIRGIKSYANFIDNVQIAQNIISNQIVEELKDSGEAIVSKDMNTYIYGSRVIYIPPNVVMEAARRISEDELKRLVGENVFIAKRFENGNIRFEIKMKPRKEEHETAVVYTSIPQLKQPVDEFSKALEEIRRSERGIINLLIEFNKESKHTIITYLNVLRNYIRKIEVKSM